MTGFVTRKMNKRQIHFAVSPRGVGVVLKDALTAVHLSVREREEVIADELAAGHAARVPTPGGGKDAVVMAGRAVAVLNGLVAAKRIPEKFVRHFEAAILTLKSEVVTWPG